MSDSISQQFYIGLDVGRTIRSAIISADGTIVKQARIVSEVSNPRVFIDQLINIIDQLRDGEEAQNRVVAVGIGWAGLINRTTQRAEANPNMVDVSGFDVHRELEAATGLPVIIDNDANVAAYGEWQIGAARGHRDVFFIGLGTGIGAGLILDGHLQRGNRGFAGEFGHFKIVLDGLECGCGSTGCLETLASGPNIVRRVREQLFSDPSFSLSTLAHDMEGTLTGERVVRAAMEKDALALGVLRETGRILGAAIASVINLLNVEVVVLGGGVMEADELILGPIREEVQRSVVQPCIECLQIVAAKLGQRAGTIGAALLARDTFGERVAQVGR